jgi:hypothetical protein
MQMSCGCAHLQAQLRHLGITLLQLVPQVRHLPSHGGTLSLRRRQLLLSHLQLRLCQLAALMQGRNLGLQLLSALQVCSFCSRRLCRVSSADSMLLLCGHCQLEVQLPQLLLLIVLPLPAGRRAGRRAGSASAVATSNRITVPACHSSKRRGAPAGSQAFSTAWPRCT